ncbi:tRNA (mnm(5)s(2)U34)-methyltransferase [Sutcliffiella horikoshii]|uniref:tRNA (mnm(5)s(2)U34)-methyltransferase n=1 Tax=Sutcliffiella horikoshii TaxID=79883 RepID=UPI001F2812E1|nr:class I SAM-dependent methyltransferase [Sutcliffiella horikoshii]MCG1021947.1 methyltransferase domain-containing protein [Sutcliffiella horikoshii]
MKLERVLPYSKKILNLAVSEGDIAVDCTVGNGHDTLFLAELVGDTGHVYGFDIQHEAIKNTEDLLVEHAVGSRVSLFEASHAELLDRIPSEKHDQIRGAIFNLGYLPGGDKGIVTVPESTINAVDKLLSVMKKEAVIVIVVYHGHPEGQVERDALLDYVTKLDQKKAHVLQYRFMNQVNNPPFIIAIEKK